MTERLFSNGDARGACSCTVGAINAVAITQESFFFGSGPLLAQVAESGAAA